MNPFKDPWGDDDKSKQNDRFKRNNNSFSVDDIDKYIDDFKKLMLAKFRSIFNNKNIFNGSNPWHQNPVVIAFAVIFALWLSTGVYTIQPEEEGVVLRFGKYVRSSVPGLNYKLPTPIEILTKVPVTRTNKEEVGYRLGSTSGALSAELLRQNSIADESQMLTTDENIVDINFDVQWNINSAKDFILNVRDLPKENTVKSVAESAMREVIGLYKINDVLAEERSKIEQDARKLMQQMLDNLRMGVAITSVQLRRIDPPKETIDAYRDVQNAKQDKEREINQATSYRNDIVPRARGEAQKFLQEAEAYQQRVIADAKGEASRFDAVLGQYRQAKDITRKKIYIETMEDVLSSLDKVILDKSANNVLPYLPINKENKDSNK